jgi:hypothetical protein
MRVIGAFNNISEKLREQIQPLLPGQYAEYQILDRIRIEDPQTGRIEVRYPHRQLWAKDTITDPYTQEVVEIGVAAAGGVDLKNQQVTKVESYEFNHVGLGIMTLDGKNAVHRELHEYLQICNFIKEGLLGEFRDATAEIIFSYIDKKKEARKKSAIFSAKKEGMVYADSMKPEEMREFAAAMNWEYKADIEEIDAKIKEFIDTKPLEFKREMEDVLLKKKAIIKKAMGVTITYDPAGHRILWANGSGVIATLERKKDENEITAFAKWLSTVANGDKILAQLRSKKQAEAPVED